MIGTTLPTPLYPLYQKTYGISAPTITIVFALYALFVVAGLLLFGHQSDRVGRRKTLQLGLLFSALSAMLFLFARGLPEIYVGRVFSGLSAGIFTGAGTAAMIDYADAARRRAVALIAIVMNLGGLGLGTLLSGALAQYAPRPLQLCYAVDFVLVIVAAIAVWSAPETIRGARGGFTLAIQHLSVPHEIREIFWRASIAGFSAFAVSGVFSAIAPGFLATELHVHAPLVSGLLVLALMWAAVLGQAVIDRIPRRYAFTAGCAGLFAGMILLAATIEFHSVALLFASALLSGVGQGIVIGFGLANINEHIREGRGAVTSAYFTVLYIGLAVPVVAVGFLAAAIGLATAGLVFSALVAVAVGTVGVLGTPQP